MSNYQRIYNRLRKAGMTDAVALGFLGNWQQESGCEPNRLQNDFGPMRIASRNYTARVMSGSISRQQFGTDQKGYGLAQWTYVNDARTDGRKFDLWDFWKHYGKALDDLDMQIDFALWELMNGYRGVRIALEGCTDLKTATEIICRRYEQPANNNVETRYELAREIETQIDKNQWDAAEKAEKGGQNMTKDTAVNIVLAIARNEIGYREKISGSGLDDPQANAGSGNYTKYARDLDRLGNFYNTPKQGYMWCDVFVDWCFVAAFGPQIGREIIFQPVGSAGAGCSFSLSYYQQAGHFHPGDPQPGDQIFYTYQAGEISHTGIVESVSGGTVTVIEGNTSDSVGRRTYQLGDSRIAGYGTPNWALVNSVSTPDTGSQDGAAQAPAEAQPAEDIHVPGKTCDVTLPELRQGDAGKPVERLQTLLIGRGYYCGGRSYRGREQPDGEFGPATEVAVKDLQLAAGINQDGVVGSDEWSALINS